MISWVGHAFRCGARSRAALRNWDVSSNAEAYLRFVHRYTFSVVQRCVVTAIALQLEIVWLLLSVS